MRRMLAFSILGAALAVPAAADNANDDLQAVRKAVGKLSADASVQAPVLEKARPPAERPPAEEEPMPPQARRPLKSSARAAACR
jgi:hypothetical protein